MAAINQIQRVSYTDKEVINVFNTIIEIKSSSKGYLLILAGKYKNGKGDFISDLSNRIGEITSVDMRSIISSNEKESFENIEKLFNSLSEKDRVLYLRNYDVLSGEYTGFTYSSVRYATPQEKYLLKKIKDSKRIVIVELVDKANIHSMLKRYTQAVIEFDEPSSALGKLFWKLKQIRLQGHTFENRRPL
jgi:predicted kinase